MSYIGDIERAEARKRAQRRERIATVALQGLLVGPNLARDDAAVAASVAVEFADALIAELDK